MAGGEHGNDAPGVFRTILYADQRDHQAAAPPVCLKDLALDRVFDAIATDRAGYEIGDIFYRLLSTSADIAYRQVITRDLIAGQVRRAVDRLNARMADMRACLLRADQHRHALQKASRVLEAALAYGDGIAAFDDALSKRPPESEGLRLCARYVAGYASSATFQDMLSEAREIEAELREVRFTTLIEGLHVRIEPAAGESDYGEHLAALFARFDEGTEHRFGFEDPALSDLDLIEERVMDQVARAFPAVFARLARFARTIGSGFADDLVVRFDREVQFYIGYLRVIDGARAAGGTFCFPTVGSGSRLRVREGFDLALAQSLAPNPVVPNDARLGPGERMLVVSGPNQGGKTTFARMIGQLHYLAMLGLPVPARAARLQMCDTILTHFERSEVAHSPHGKLQEELVRLHAILEDASDSSLVILNELFSSTTFRDAFALSADIARVLGSRGTLCVWVTFLDRLTELDPSMVSMVSLVDPDDPARRTFRVERRAADGMAFARAIASKYGLAPRQLSERLPS